MGARVFVGGRGVLLAPAVVGSDAASPVVGVSAVAVSDNVGIFVAVAGTAVSVTVGG